MAQQIDFDPEALTKFEADYDSSHEDIALQTRGQFLEAFPVSGLGRLTLSEYVVGQRKPTFCTFVESRTRAWASIQGATSRKFGIYFGKTKSDPRLRYRYVNRFGNTPETAFGSIKSALVDLVRMGAGAHLDYTALDSNPLSQMFKAKILSLYFPERFLAVCSSEHLEKLGSILGFGTNRPSSEYQSLLLEARQVHSATQRWSNLKFVAFLYRTHLSFDRKVRSPIKKPVTRSHRRVDFEQIQKQRGQIGMAAEKFALAWEERRLRGAGLRDLIAKIDDLRSRPGCGYDFRSHDAEGQLRFIEVKSVAYLDHGHRFFLSDNEHSVSTSGVHSAAYYFYLVFFDKTGEPNNLIPMLAHRLYQIAELAPAAYVVRFDLKGRPEDPQG
jgi:hypothetical protein